MIMNFKKKSVDVWERISIGMGGLAVIGGFIVLFRYDPELAKFVAYLIGGGLLLWQVWASSKRANAADKTAKAMQKTADLTEKGNIAERFKNAIEHLGHDSTSIRLGGIYALHHIAQDEKDYSERVFEILCAHIRETTTQDGYKPKDIQIGGKNSKIFPRPSIEIQSILKLLFLKPPDHRTYEGLRYNLDHANLKGANFKNSNMPNARLVSANLQGVNFEEADLQNANFIVANLQGVNFKEADLQNAILVIANLQGADLSSTKNLTAEQLLKAETLYKAKLPNGMEAEIKQRKPELLEKPKPDNEPDV